MTTKTTTPKTALQKAKERAEALAKQAQQAKAKAQRLEAIARANEAKADRARDTKRKVLLGAYLLTQARAHGWELAALNIGQQPLSDYLTRKEDRALFGLPPVPVAQGAAEPPAGQQAG